jgi:glycosyltransferase AglD
MKGVSLFVPVYNEEKRIESHIKKLREELDRIGEPFEMFIIDDGSTDMTGKIVREVIKDTKDARIKYRRFENGPSRRENLALSFRESCYDKCFFIDLDLIMDTKEVGRLIKEFAAEVNGDMDLCIGSRYKGIKPKRTFFRMVISLAYNTFMRIYFNSKIEDNQCGFKAFKRGIVLGLVDEMGYDAGLKRGWFWDAELLIRAQRKGYSIKEIPINWKEGMKSSFRVRREIKMIPYILTFRFKRE